MTTSATWSSTHGTSPGAAGSPTPCSAPTPAMSSAASYIYPPGGQEPDGTGRTARDRQVLGARRPRRARPGPLRRGPCMAGTRLAVRLHRVRPADLTAPPLPARVVGCAGIAPIRQQQARESTAAHPRRVRAPDRRFCAAQNRPVRMADSAQMSRFCRSCRRKITAGAHGKFRNLRPEVTLLSMARPRAPLLDFYGTLVHEDTTVIQAICREVSRNARGDSPGEVARTWSSAFTALTAASHGTGFRLQRDLARMSLTDAVRYHHSAADPGSLLEAQFAYWQRPQIHPGARELLATTLPACAVSNIDRADLDAALAHHEMAGYFTHLVTSQDARLQTQAGDVHHRARASRARPARGHPRRRLTDQRRRQRPARLGMPVAWVNHQGRPAPEAGPRPTYEVADLGELLVLLDGGAQAGAAAGSWLVLAAVVALRTGDRARKTPRPARRNVPRIGPGSAR